MAELPSKVHLTSHPILLKRGPSVYEDEKDRPWLYLIKEKEIVLQVLLRQGEIPIEDIALTPSQLTSYTMPLMWTLNSASEYLDDMNRSWLIVSHLKVNGVEEMILEMIKDS